MKATVDLTEDRMFPDQGKKKLPDWIPQEDSYETINKWFTKEVNRIPWEIGLNFITCDEDFNKNHWSNIAGSAEQYRQREEWRRADSIDYCDRCGCRIRTPWRWDRSLCDECSVQLTIEVKNHKIPWEEEWENINTRARGRTLWIGDII